MLQRFPNVVLARCRPFLRNRIIPRPHPVDRSRGYWEVSTGSPLDYPMQDGCST